MIVSKYLCLFLSACWVSVVPVTRTDAQSRGKQVPPRLLVLTDISAFIHPEGEPDDSQSMIRLMLYTNEINIEGLVATSNLGHGQRTRPELIRQVIEAYGQVHANLLLHDKHYPPAQQLMALVKQGQPIAGPKVPVEKSVGEGKDTEGSDWIIQVVDKHDPYGRPVWIAAWGGTADLAQALWKVRATRSPEALKTFISKIRVHAIYDQDATGRWIREQFPDLYYVFRHHGIRGMYRGGDTTLVRSAWVEANIRKGHGPLGALYTNYRGGDIWSGRMGRVKGIKEGDTPSFLYLMKNGLNVPDDPTLGNWGGRFKRDAGNPMHWVEDVDQFGDYKTDPDDRMAALYRWRPAWQADFAARLDWCVKSFEEANHAPQLRSAGNKTQSARAGKRVKLRAPRASDPDGDQLNYRWYFYLEEGTYQGEIPALEAEGAAASFVAPRVSSQETIHVILEVSDDGSPSLTRYQRFVVSVKP